MPKSSNPDQGWEETFAEYLARTRNGTARTSFEYLVKKGCPRNGLLSLLEVCALIDKYEVNTREKALRLLGTSPKQISTMVKQLKGTADFMERINHQQLVGNAFRQWPNVLRKAAKDLRDWKPVLLRKGVRQNQLLIAHFVKLATGKAHYSQVVDVIEAAYGACGLSARLTQETLSKTYTRRKLELSSPAYETRLRRFLNQR